jgi:hypothetical protein
MSGDADDDGDDVAFDEGMEPESATGDVESPSGGDDDDAYDDGDSDGGVAAGGPIARVISASKGTRHISPKVKELAAEMAKKYKASGGFEADDLEPLDHEDAPMEPPTPTADTPAKAKEEPPPPPPEQKPVVDDAETAKLRQEIADRQAQLEAREAKLLEQERAGDLAKLRETYFDKGAPAIVEILKKWSSADGDELKDEIADLITDLSIHIGVDVPREVRDALENRRTRKGVKVWKAEQERTVKEQAAAAEKAQEEQNRVKVMGILSQEISKAEHVERFPWLVAEPNPGQIILDVVEAAKAADGTKLTWQEAAKRANDYLKTESLAYFDKRKHLLSAATGKADAPSGQQQQRKQGDPQGTRSQAPPPKPPTPPPPKPAQPAKWDPEAHRRAIKAKHRNAFKPTNDE